jgi:hypothetical protein
MSGPRGREPHHAGRVGSIRGDEGMADGAAGEREAGVSVPFFQPHDSAADLRLYDLLASEHGRGAYGQYNALLRRLISFERALEARHSRHLAA